MKITNELQAALDRYETKMRTRSTKTKHEVYTTEFNLTPEQFAVWETLVKAQYYSFAACPVEDRQIFSNGWPDGSWHRKLAKKDGFALFEPIKLDGEKARQASKDYGLCMEALTNDGLYELTD